MAPADGDQVIQQILVVDDSRAQRRVLSKILSRWGFSVLEAVSGAQALEIIKYYRVDLVLSDWMMPEMTGVEFCKKFRALERDHYGYFILLTSKSEKGEVAHGLEVGADDFLTKPVASNELRARITAGARVLRMERELTEKNALVTNTLSEMSELYETLDRDLIEAKKLQHSLVRERFKEMGNAQVSLLLRPAGHVGGDLVGQFPIDDENLGLFAVDVSGHGITSALITARLAGFLSGAAPEQNVALKKKGKKYAAEALEKVAEQLNRLCMQEFETEHYFTLLLATINTKTGEVSFVQAGHPHPVIQRANGNIEYLGSGGNPVGLLEDVSYEQVTFYLQDGDRLLILSDGFTECPNPHGELLEEEGLEHLLHDISAIRGPDALESLVLGLQNFAGDVEFPDDVSAIMVEFNKTD
ncbi:MULTISPECIES: PP2C family protein-serine/threonine phosphatase [Halocynthiibacter]|uniref:SpoIIE family protein phosphatase n=1 Tax=Halocynthiibacter halioticoli TaxID=2986804 RepID=A0AAE3J1F1_9RHOB|nr:MULTISPECIES: SpoIIE family protein phosphatase [Halocynthiibacter]MCV6825589.1 SpoIIE family protein phosphatase [Halocynthiibacter halioticoli]MCW4058590.1 SpoIIE family protein phosphatase [Halocynthiibacter sp. SDUM655004]